MRAWTASIIIIMLGLCVPALAEDDGALAVLASGEQLQARVGLLGDNGGEVGVFGIYLADVTGTDTDERYGGGMYATYNVVTDANMPLGDLFPFGTGLDNSVEYDGYFGAMIGLLEGDNAFAALLAGVELGNLFAEYQWQPGPDLWNELPTMADQHKLFVGVKWQW